MGGKQSFPVVKLPNDRIVVITGANTCIGYEAAKWVAMMGATVIMACRSKERAENAMQKIRDEFQVEKEKRTPVICDTENVSMEFMELDLSSFKSVRGFIDAYKSSGRALHVLVCNAGVALVPFRKTEDGFEVMFQVNYLSHFIMIAHLLPIMIKSGEDCRIVLVSSDAHRACNFDVNKINYSGVAKQFERWDYYGRSKLYQCVHIKQDLSEKKIRPWSCRDHKFIEHHVYYLDSRTSDVVPDHADALHAQKTQRVQHLSQQSASRAGGNGNLQELPGLSTHDTINSTCYVSSADVHSMHVAAVQKLQTTRGVFSRQMKTPKDGALPLINAVVNPDLKGVGGVYFESLKRGYSTKEARTTIKRQQKKIIPPGEMAYC